MTDLVGTATAVVSLIYVGLQVRQNALQEVRTLSGMLPMCAWCRKIRDDKRSRSQIGAYLERQTGAVVSHGLCPDRARNVAEEWTFGVGTRWLFALPLSVVRATRALTRRLRRSRRAPGRF